MYHLKGGGYISQKAAPAICRNGLSLFSTKPGYYRKAKYITAIRAIVATTITRMNLRFSARSFSDLCSLENFCLIDIIYENWLVSIF